jgi:hypothetical protein
MVIVDSDSELEGGTPAIARKKSQVKSKAATVNSKTSNESNPKTLKVQVQAQRKPAIGSADNEVTITTASLPEFTRAAWATSFLPTLYDCLGCSNDPFVIAPDMVKVLQEIIDVVWTEVDYKVRVGDKIFTLVRQVMFFICTSTDRLLYRRGIASMRRGPSLAEKQLKLS